jgi:prolyl-tRNA synthetase
MSSSFVRTLRDDPADAECADAEVPSRRLLVRAGHVRRAAAGTCTWLPLGRRAGDGIVERRGRGTGQAEEVAMEAVAAAVNRP